MRKAVLGHYWLVTFDLATLQYVLFGNTFTLSTSAPCTQVASQQLAIHMKCLLPAVCRALPITEKPDSVRINPFQNTCCLAWQCNIWAKGACGCECAGIVGFDTDMGATKAVQQDVSTSSSIATVRAGMQEVERRWCQPFRHNLWKYLLPVCNTPCIPYCNSTRSSEPERFLAA